MKNPGLQQVDAQGPGFASRPFSALFSVARKPAGPNHHVRLTV